MMLYNCFDTQHNILIVSGSAYLMILIRIGIGPFHFVVISFCWRRVRVATVPMTGGLFGGGFFCFFLFVLLVLLLPCCRPHPWVLRLRFILLLIIVLLRFFWLPVFLKPINIRIWGELLLIWYYGMSANLIFARLTFSANSGFQTDNAMNSLRSLSLNEM